jgi:hypothetical protein
VSVKKQGNRWRSGTERVNKQRRKKLPQRFLLFFSRNREEKVENRNTGRPSTDEQAVQIRDSEKKELHKLNVAGGET